MKYAFLLCLMAAILGGYGFWQGGWYYLLLWPAANFLLVGGSYLTGSTAIFGKRSNGTMNPLNRLLLLPFIILLEIVWHFVRVFYKESPVNQLDDQLIIGRRLLGREVPGGIDNIVDLTCEFPEPKAVREGRNYLCRPILDASVPAQKRLRELVDEVEQLEGVTFVHCAQGHGRTGLIVAALLLKRNPKLTVEEVLEKLKVVRPKLDCSDEQLKALEKFRDALE